MTIRLYMDHQIPAAITRGLQARQIDVLTAFEDAANEFDDESLLRRATSLSRVIFTQDDDFLAIGHQWQMTNQMFSGIIYAHQLKTTIGQAVRDLELVAQIMTPEEMKDRIEFLPLR